MPSPFLHGPARLRPGGRGPIAVLVLGVAIALAFAAVTLATPGDELASGEALDEERGQIRVLEAELQRIDADATAAAGEHAAALRLVEELEGRIHDATLAMAEAKAARAVAEERLADRIVALYVQEPPSLVEVVLSSGGLSEMLDAGQALEAISDSDRSILRGIEESRARLTALKAELEGDRAEALAVEAAARRRMDDLQGLLASRRAVLHEAQATLDALEVEEDRQQEADRRERLALVAAGREAEAQFLGQADPAAPASLAVSAQPPADSVPAALERIAECESGGNPQAVSSSGQYRGKYQFDTGTWQAVGGSGDPAAASEAEQDRLAAVLYERRGPAPWPICGFR
jgi:peptidoglycan hydrolase CwlO-like protein